MMMMMLQISHHVKNPEESETTAYFRLIIFMWAYSYTAKAVEY
jgi:hypothetical protein